MRRGSEYTPNIENVAGVLPRIYLRCTICNKMITGKYHEYPGRLIVCPRCQDQRSPVSLRRARRVLRKHGTNNCVRTMERITIHNSTEMVQASSRDESLYEVADLLFQHSNSSLGFVYVRSCYYFSAREIKYDRGSCFGPSATIWIGRGNCLSKCILLAALLKIADFQVALIYLPEKKHTFLKVLLDSAPSWASAFDKENGWLYMDPTSKSICGYLPRRDQGLLVEIGL